MKFVIQRVSKASVTIDNNVVGKIDNGFLVLIGICEDDTEQIADKMVDKMIKLRIFDDEEGKTNLSLNDVNGALLLVSQFTLYADCKKGNRPSFLKAGNPEFANKMYEYIIKKAKTYENMKVERGEFGGDMKVELLNDGPFTIILDSNEIM